MEYVAIGSRAYILPTAERNAYCERRVPPPSMLRLLGAEGARVPGLVNILRSTVGDAVPFRVIGLTSECSDDPVLGIDDGARGSGGYGLVGGFNRWVGHPPPIPLDMA